MRTGRIVASSLVIWVVVLAVIAHPLTALAHAYVVRSNPAQNAVLEKPPRQVEIWFDESVQAVFDAVTVMDAGGHRVDNHDAHIDKRDSHRLECTLSPGLKPGIYTVAWRVISADGHPVDGVITFRVGHPAGGTVGNVGGGSSIASPGGTLAGASGGGGYRPGVDMVVVRWLAYAGMTTYLGLTVFKCFILSAAASTVRSMRWLWRARLVAALALLLGVTLSLPVQTRIDAGVGWSLAISPTLMGTMLTATRFGHIWPVQFGLTLLLLVVAWLAGRVQRADKAAKGSVPRPEGALVGPATAGLAVPAQVSAGGVNQGNMTYSQRQHTPQGWKSSPLDAVAIVGGVAVLVCQSLIGHAAAEAAPVLPVVADVGHLLAASIWFGGLLGLTLLGLGGCREHDWGPNRNLHQHPRQDGDAGQRHLLSAMRRFGPWAAASLMVVAGTGLYASFLNIPTWYALIHTAYGRTLLVKLALFVCMAALGGLHFVVVRRAQRLMAAGWGRVGLWLEATLGAAILAVTTVLANLPTAMAAPGPVDQTIALSRDVSARLQISPNVIGRNRFLVQLTRDGRPDTEVQQAELTFTMPSMPMAAETVRLRPVTAGRYQTQGPYLSTAGRWDVHLHVLTKSFSDEDADFRIIVGSQNGG
jgi:copper transport protein